MSRSEQRAVDRSKQKLAKEINKLTPNQLKLIDEITKFRTGEIIDSYEKIVEKAIYTSMRTNRVGQERADKIIKQANKIILEKWVRNC